MTGNSVFTTFLNLCRPLEAGPWPCLGAPWDCYACPPCADAAVEQLRNVHDDEQLRQAGVVSVAEGKLALRAALAGSDRTVIALRSEIENEPFALLTMDGIVADDVLPAIAVLSDAHTRQLIDLNGLLYIAFSTDSLLLLRALEFPVVNGTGISSLDEAGFQRLAAACQWSHGAEDDSTRPLAMPLEIALVGWSPPRLVAEAPIELTTAVKQLLDGQRHHAWNLSQIALWQPSVQELADLRSALNTQNTALAKQRMHDSARKSLFRLDAPSNDSDSLGQGMPDINEARARLEHELCARPRDTSPAKLAEARRNYELAIAAHVGMLRRELIATDDQQRRHLGLVASELAATIHRASPFIGRSNVESGAVCSPSDLVKFIREYRNLSKDLRA